jgi:hypothetical protein
MSYEIHSFGLSMQANRATCSEFERRTDLAFPLLRSPRNIPIAGSAVNAQSALSITTAVSLILKGSTGLGIPNLERSVMCEIGVTGKISSGIMLVDATFGMLSRASHFCSAKFCLRGREPYSRRKLARCRLAAVPGRDGVNHDPRAPKTSPND